MTRPLASRRMPAGHCRAQLDEICLRRIGSARRTSRRKVSWHEYRLKLAGRTADDLQDFGSCGLLLQRLAQLACSRLHLIEQAHVLDRDHRLVGEGGRKL